MELSAAIRQRRMARNFTTEPIDHAVVSSIFSDAVRAPSAGFAQGAEFLVLASPERRKAFWDLVSEPSWREGSAMASGVMRAPVVALCLVDAARYRSRFGAADKSSSTLGANDVSSWSVAYPTVDSAFSTMIVLLSAEAVGLGALFFHLQGRERLVLDGLGVPTRFDVIGAVALGHRGDDVGSRSPEKIARRTVGGRIHFEQYEEGS